MNGRSHKATIRPGGRDGSVERAGAAMSMLALAVRRGAHVFRDAARATGLEVDDEGNLKEVAAE